MRTTETYQDDINAKYLHDKEQGSLRGNLHKPTPSSIRKVCLNIYDETKVQADVLIMKNFFSNGKGESLRQKINTYDLDSFRPIRNFLIGGTSSIKSHDTLELTALIVNFKPRPYNKYRQSCSDENTNADEQQNSPKKEQQNGKSKKEEREKDTIIIAPIPYPLEGTEKTSNNSNHSDGDNSGGNEDINRESIIQGGGSSMLKTPGKKKSETGKSVTTTVNIKIIVISSIILLSAIIIIPLNKTKWMVWENGEYIETKFDTDKYEFQQLKIYNRNRIVNFKQYKTVNCDTKFFKVNGKPNMWYGKNAKGELEYFTDYGDHPETGKKLKKITEYMIKKYICPEWE